MLLQLGWDKPKLIEKIFWKKYYNQLINKPTVSKDDIHQRNLYDYKQLVPKDSESFERLIRKLGEDLYFFPEIGNLVALIKVKEKTSMENQRTITS